MDVEAAKTPSEAPVRSNRASRIVLVLIIVVAFASLAVPPAVKMWLDRDACPTTVTTHGFAEKVRWEISRADCGGGRIVHQLRVIPPKGYSVLVYESDGGPLPTGWSQTGFVGTVTLDRAIDGESTTALQVGLDPKGRPVAPILVRDGKRRAAP